MLKTNAKSKKIAGLDGFRFLAFTFVLLCHTLPQPSNFNSGIADSLLNIIQLNGIIGMQFFFFLSAFLLTYLSLKRGINQFSFFTFIRNRTLRILPLYTVILLLGFVLYPLICELFNKTFHIPPIAYFLSFTQNFYFGIDESHKLVIFFLLITWSIAVEVQFYFLLGLALKYFKKYIFHFGVLLLLIGFIFDCIGFYNGNGHYFHTLSYFSDFGAGVAFAHLWFKKKDAISKYQPKKTYAGLFFCSIIVLLLWNYLFQNSAVLPVSNILFPFVFCWLVLHQMHPKTNYFKPAQVEWVESLGEISYGLYLYHGIVIALFVFISEQMGIYFLNGIWSLLFPILVLFLSILCAKLSYRFLELPFLKMK